METRLLGLFREKIEVRDRHGHAMPALLAVCPACDCRGFVAYHILSEDGKSHLHLQCIECGDSYCDGTCEDLRREAEAN